MRSYLKSELYRLTHYKWTYLFVAICSALLISSNVVLAAVKGTDAAFPYANTDFSFSNAYNNMFLVFVLCMSVTGMVFNNEYSNHTFKNSISYGITRGTLYFGKLLVQILYAFIAFTIIMGSFVLSAYLLLENSKQQEFEALLRASAACFPLFIFALATTNCFAFIIENTGSVTFASSGLLIALPLVCNFLGMRFGFFRKLAEMLPMNMMNTSTVDPVNHTLLMYWDTPEGFRNCFLLGIIQILIITILGFILFRKKEVK